MKLTPKEKRPPGVNPSHRTQGFFTNQPDKKYQGFTYVPSNHRFSTYPLADDVINNAVREFRRTEEYFPSGVVSDKVIEMIDQVYLDLGQDPPDPRDITYLFKRHQFGPLSKVTSKQFKKLVKELSGVKSYNRGDIFKPDISNETLVKSSSGNFFLTDAGRRRLPSIFRHHDVDDDGLVDFFAVLGIFEVLFSSENQLVPPRNVIEALFKHHNLKPQSKISLKIAKRLLKELLGLKQYADIIAQRNEIPEVKQSGAPVPDIPIHEKSVSTAVDLKSTMESQKKSTDPGFVYSSPSAINEEAKPADKSAQTLAISNEIQKVARKAFSSFDLNQSKLLAAGDLILAVGKAFDLQNKPRPTKNQIGQALLDLALFTKSQLTLNDFQQILTLFSTD